ncbi:MAG: hypothetical protein OXG35_32250 [Acidobacteria bacterium]|nr:hypothetical protein [Acidobacteriota bacterium]
MTEDRTSPEHHPVGAGLDRTERRLATIVCTMLALVGIAGPTLEVTTITWILAALVVGIVSRTTTMPTAGWPRVLIHGAAGVITVTVMVLVMSMTSNEPINLATIKNIMAGMTCSACGDALLLTWRRQNHADRHA